MKAALAVGALALAALALAAAAAPATDALLSVRPRVCSGLCVARTCREYVRTRTSTCCVRGMADGRRREGDGQGC